MLSLDGGACPHEVKGIPVSYSPMEDEPQGVATAALVEWVCQAGQVLQVVYPVSRSLLPSCLTGEHQIRMIEEEKTHYDSGHESDNQ